MKFSLGVLLAALPLLTVAEVVVPIDSVEEHVNVRLSPDSKSEIVGHLNQGDAAVLLSTDGDWHEVEIVGGSTGYISVDWTNVVAEAPLPAAEPSAEEAAEETVESSPEVSARKLSEESSEKYSEEKAGALAVADQHLPTSDEEAPEPAETPDIAEAAQIETQEQEAVDEDSSVVDVPVEESVEEVVESISPEEPLPEAQVSEETPSDTSSLSEVAQAEVAEIDSVAAESMTTAPVDGETTIVPVAIAAQGPRGPAGPPGEATIKGTQNFLVKFSKPETGANSQIYDDGNSVGIGTKEPKQRLEVNGNIQIHEQNSSVAGLMITQSSGETGYIMHNRASTLTIGAGSVDRLTIDREGNLGIGVSRPSHPIEMASGAHVTAGGVWTNSSSRARKENISNLSAKEALAALSQLQPVQFNYKNEQHENYVGFIAEDVPALVATNGRNSLSTMDIVAVLTKVVQEQQQKIAELEARLNSTDRGQVRIQ